MQFASDTLAAFGICRNASRNGLRAVMETYIAPGTSGRLLLYRSKLPLEVPVEAAYIDDAEVAFIYRVDSSEELAHIDAYLHL